jgi:WXG100 family type VII secretion target
MADHQPVRVQPEVMHAASQALSGAAQDWRTRLGELDSEVRDLLAGWRGDAGGSYGQAWDLWHKGAGEVQQGLAILAKMVETAGTQFQAQDSTAKQIMDGVYRG